MEAGRLLDRGEALLREHDVPHLLSLLLAGRAEVAWRSGERVAAEAALEEARTIVPEGDVGTADEIDRVQALLDQSQTGNR